MGDIDTLAHRDKLYIFDFLKATTPGAYGHGIPEELVDLPLELGEEGPAGPRALQDRRPAGRDRAAGDRAPGGGREPHGTATSWSWPSTAAGWWARSGPTPTSTGRRSPSRCQPAVLNTGGNELEITVRKRNPYIHPPLVFEWAELSIRYR